MGQVAQVHQEELNRIKDNIAKSYEYFRENRVRWHRSKKFLYVCGLTDEDIRVLQSLGKPELEFNILEAYVSRQKGEFAKQEPSITVGAGENQPPDPQTIKVVEGYLQGLEKESRNNNTSYAMYDDILSGGYSVARVFTKYPHEMAFDQEIAWERVFDPTLCGFDPLAQQNHKGDGDYAFELFVWREKEFKDKYPNLDISSFNFSAEIGDFNWSYTTAANDKTILIGDYYEKKKKRVKIVKLSNKAVMTEDAYEKFLVEWEQQGKIEQPPQLLSSRVTSITTIVRYRICESTVLDYKVTNYSYLPLVFFDGDSTKYRNDGIGELEQHTRPYCYQAFGVQRLKNFAGQTLTNEIENMVQHKFKIPKEAIPAEYLDAYTDYQMPNLMIYNSFLEDNPDVRLNPPEEIARIPTPPEVINAFMGADQTTQAILGTYDATLGINKTQLSGIAIEEGATQSNAVAMPRIKGFLNGLQQVANIVIDLIPKYYITPRTVPVKGRNGKKEYVVVNQNGSPNLQYSPNALNVSVEAGVNFSIQKSRALKTLIALMETSPTFAQFINSTKEGLGMLLDNIEMRGIDALKNGVDNFIEQQQAATQNAPPKNTDMIKLQLQREKISQDGQIATQKAKIDAAGVAVNDKNADTNRLQVLTTLNANEAGRELEADKVQAERERNAVDIAIKAADMSHSHVKDSIELSHKISQSRSQND